MRHFPRAVFIQNKEKNLRVCEILDIASTNENKKGNTVVIQNNNVLTAFGLLLTAYVNVIYSTGQKRIIRMLFDSGS